MQKALFYFSGSIAELDAIMSLDLAKPVKKNETLKLLVILSAFALFMSACFFYSFTA